MTNNDILRRLRFSFEYNDKQMLSLFALANLQVNEDLLLKWLKKDDDAQYTSMSDEIMATFLNGFITHHRGKGDGEAKTPEKILTNNIILNKLKIALNLKADDIIAMLAEVDFNLSKHELSAMFRKADHKHYRECKDQILRNFLQAIQNKYRQSPIRHVSGITTAPKKEQYKANYKAAKSDVANKTARPKASKIYVNPNATKPEENKSARKVLKLSADKIWQENDK